MKIQDYMPDRRSICHLKAANKVLGANGDRAAASTRMELTETVSAAPQYSDPLPSKRPAAALVPVFSKAHPLMLEEVSLPNLSGAAVGMSSSIALTYLPGIYPLQ